MNKDKRKGRGVKDIPAERLAQLNAGAEAVTLTECLAVDFAVLMEKILPGVGDDGLATIRASASTGILKRMSIAAQVIDRQVGVSARDRLANHSSDTARGWACFLIGRAEDLDLTERLEAIQPFADDPHFAVREWAWMAVRPHLAAKLERAIALLSPWTAHPSERIRRFASEAIRPRGVWCAHIADLKTRPQIALPVLEPLRADPAVYVQDSVGNWLNDASKGSPDWVWALCARWTTESSTPETARICRRALRTIQPRT